MVKIRSYEQWKGYRIFVEDMRPFTDGMDDYHDAQPGYFFRYPTGDCGRDWAEGGQIQINKTTGMFYVIVGNSDGEFSDIEQATKWLWDNWAKAEVLEPATLWRFYLFNSDGQVTHQSAKFDYDAAIKHARSKIASEYDPGDAAIIRALDDLDKTRRIESAYWSGALVHVDNS